MRARSLQQEWHCPPGVQPVALTGTPTPGNGGLILDNAHVHFRTAFTPAFIVIYACNPTLLMQQCQSPCQEQLPPPPTPHTHSLSTTPCPTALPPPPLFHRYAGVTGWSSVLRTLLVHQEHWQSLGLLNFLQLASTPPAGAGEWEEEEEGLEVQGAEWAGQEEEGEEEEYGEYRVLGFGGKGGGHAVCVGGGRGGVGEEGLEVQGAEWAGEEGEEEEDGEWSGLGLGGAWGAGKGGGAGRRGRVGGAGHRM